MKIALLSYSTHGSGGKNSDLEKYHYIIEQIPLADLSRGSSLEDIILTVQVLKNLLQK